MKGKSIKFAVMTIQEAGSMLTHQLRNVYDPREASNIADRVMEHLTGWKKIDRIVRKTELLDDRQTSALREYLQQLLACRPVQYVLGEAWFCGMPFFVDERVLIPRPETEELVAWIIADWASDGAVSIFDVGTGSGCIPIALKKRLPSAMVSACDISAPALEVAEQNAKQLGSAIDLFRLDILDAAARDFVPAQDIIVSNPPYIPRQEKPHMHRNVVDHEPHTALFVDDDDPLIFYRSIAALGKARLRPGGKIYVEIHEDLAEGVSELFSAARYRLVEIKKDMQGKQRMIRATGL